MLISVIVAALIVQAQAPPRIQFFMPGGGLPTRELRFELTRDDGRVELLFTDTKGMFQLTGGLTAEGDYIIRIEGDGRTFETTVTRFRIVRSISYIPVFLNPLKGEIPAREVVDVADAKAPDDAKAAYTAAMQAVSEGQAEAAISEFNRALNLYPQYLRALNDLGVLYLKLNRLDEAAATFNRAIALNKRFYHPRLNLGVVYNRQGRFSEAVGLLEQLHKEVPTLAGLRAAFADALGGTGKTAEAKKLIATALGEAGLSNQAKSELHFKLGVVLNREEKFAEAATELEQAVRLDQSAANARLQLGGAYLQLKKLPEAEGELLKAYELGGSGAGAAQLFLGQIYFMQQKYQQSQLAFEQYLRDVPNAPNAAQIREVIEKLKAALKNK
jgi:superkiller protein 3